MRRRSRRPVRAVGNQGAGGDRPMPGRAEQVVRLTPRRVARPERRQIVSRAPAGPPRARRYRVDVTLNRGRAPAGAGLLSTSMSTTLAPARDSSPGASLFVGHGARRGAHGFGKRAITRRPSGRSWPTDRRPSVGPDLAGLTTATGRPALAMRGERHFIGAAGFQDDDHRPPGVQGGPGARPASSL